MVAHPGRLAILGRREWARSGARGVSGETGADVDNKKIWMWVGIAAAVIVVGVAAWYFLAGGSSDTATVPEVVGMPAGDAVRALQDAGFVLGASTQTTDTTVAAGLVVEQSPKAGAELEKGGTVDIIVSAKAAAIQVPDLVSMDASAAADALTAAGLVPAVYRDYNAAKANTVFAQVPEAASEVAPGTTVAIGVSLGAAPTNPKVPSVVGKTQAQATSTLENAGFKVQVFQSYNSTTAAGSVFSQFPAPNTVALAGSTVAVGVSQGKAPAAPSTPSQPANVKVPNVTGKTESQATTALRDAGLQVATYEVFSDTVAKGTVVGQMPAAGASVARNTVVGIAVSQGKAPASVTVPNVVGRSIEDAFTELEAAGLVPVAVPDATASEPDGTITDQLPGPGSKVAPNSRVVVVVSGEAVPTPYK